MLHSITFIFKSSTQILSHTFIFKSSIYRYSRESITLRYIYMLKGRRNEIHNCMLASTSNNALLRASRGKAESNVPIHTVLSGRIIPTTVSLAVCLSTPCLTLLLHRRPAISVTSHQSTWVCARAERVNRAATLRCFHSRENTCGSLKQSPVCLSRD